MKRKATIKCPHCGADLLECRPPPDGPSIGRRYTQAELEKEMAAAIKPKRAGRPPIGAKAMSSTERARRTRAKAKRSDTV
jgi:hypothetical protein